MASELLVCLVKNWYYLSNLPPQFLFLYPYIGIALVKGLFVCMIDLQGIAVTPWAQLVKVLRINYT